MLPHDAAWKLLFSFPEMVRDLLGAFVPHEWVEELDLSTLERWPGSHVSDDLRQRHQDRVWRVRFRGRWLHVLVMLEFQSAVDRTMAVRILAYTALLYQDLLRTSSTPLPPVLPIVLYHGSERWTAAKDMAGLLAPYGGLLAPYQPAQRYFLLDVRGYTGSLPKGRNRMAALIRLVRGRGLNEMVTVFAGLTEWLAEPEHEGLIRAFWAWLEQVPGQEQLSGAKWPTLNNWREARTVLQKAAKGWSVQLLEEGRAKGSAEGRTKGLVEGRTKGLVEGRTKGLAEGRTKGLVEGRTKGLVEGRAKGSAEVMRRQAARKFDAETAQRLARRLAEIADPERVGEVGEWLIECEDGDELLERVERLCGTTAAGDGHSRG